MFKCEECFEIVNSKVSGKCQKCHIGTKNPAIWAFENIRNSILKSMKVNPGLNNWHREQSESVRYRIDGCYMPDKPYTLQEAKNIVVIHPIVGCYISRHSHQVSTKDITKVTLHFYRWTDNGMTSYKNGEQSRTVIQIKDIDFLVEEGVPHYLEALTEVIKHARTGLYICSSCDKFIETNYLRHFAGIYCDVCWKRHQKENSGTCGLCRKPYYECCC